MNKTQLVQSTAGVVLDPYSILMSGCVRKTSDTKTQVEKDGFFDILHGEAKFKQAFTNACHFAETMNVIGPVCQLSLGENPSAMHNAMFWKAPVGSKDNAVFFDNVQRFLQVNKHINVDYENMKCPEGMGNLLHVMPDLTLGMSQADVLGDEYQFRGDVAHHIFDRRDDAFNFYRKDGPNDQGFFRGGPVAALLAVVFTFKKPYGFVSSDELTNLGGWPPVCFLLPVLVPAGTQVKDRHRGDNVRTVVTSSQPSMMSYQIRLRSTSNRHKRTVPFGQPYKLTSVSKWGKPADPLRSLSDVFKALWSQATQYCAWNTMFDFQAGEPGDNIPSSRIGELALDPIGAGRRIRGHNRYANKFDMYGMSMLWEDGFSMNDLTPTGFNLGGLDTRPIKGQGRRYAISNNNSKREHYSVVYVTPSFLGSETERNLLPVVMSMFRFFFGHSEVSGNLADLMDGSTCSSVSPRDMRDGPTAIAGIESESFTDHMFAHYNGPMSSGNTGVLPIHNVQSTIAFNKEGTPNFFGLRAPCATPMRAESDPSDLPSNAELLHDFKFTEAFCSKSTRGLTDAFEKVTKTAAKKMAAGLTDDDDIVNLFDVADDEEMM